jgi:acetyltransferase-like isoleucine patch superfamily enzyme
LRYLRHRHKFAKIGKKCSILGGCHLDIEGHLEMGHYCRIREGVRIRVHPGAKLIIGDRVLLSWNCLIEVTEYMEIHDRAGIGEFARVRDGAHLIYGTTEGWRYAPSFAEPVIIGKDAFIGSASFISHGVTIGDGAVVGAHAVVTKSVPEFEVWGGVPAKFIRHRTKDLPPEMQAFADKLIAEKGIKDERRQW